MTPDTASPVSRRERVRLLSTQREIEDRIGVLAHEYFNTANEALGSLFKAKEIHAELAGLRTAAKALETITHCGTYPLPNDTSTRSALGYLDNGGPYPSAAWAKAVANYRTIRADDSTGPGAPTDESDLT